MVEKFTPDIKEIKNYDLGEVTKVTINSEAIIPILAEKIYKDPMSAIRELYNNEVTACKKTLRQYPEASPRIEIIFNDVNRELKIRGIDSLGIDLETFKEVVSVMGNSGNNVGTDIGYFGLGFYSYVKLSERCIVKTKARKTNDEYAVVGKSALAFERLSDDLYEKLDSYGTEVILTVKDEISTESIKKKVTDLIALSGIPTTFILNDNIYPIKQFKDITEYFKNYYYDFFNNDSCKYSMLYSHLKTDDFELIVGKVKGGDWNTEIPILRECRLANTPIGLEHKILDEVLSHKEDIFIINLFDERTYKPKPDREQFEQDSENKIIGVIKSNKIFVNNRNQEEIDKKYPTMRDWLNDKERFFYIPEPLKVDCIAHDSQKGYRGRIRGKELSKIIGEWKGGKIETFLVSHNARTTTLQQLVDRNIFAVTVKREDNRALLERFGFKDLKKFLGKNKERNLVTLPVKTKAFVFHDINLRTHTTAKEGAIIISSPQIHEDRKRLRYQKFHHFKSDDILLITENADYEGTTYRPQELPLLIGFNTCFVTNKGILGLKEVMEYDEIEFWANDKEYFLQSEFMQEPELGKFKGLIVFHNTRKEDLLKLYCNLTGRYSGEYHENLTYEFAKKRLKNKTLMRIVTMTSAYHVNRSFLKDVLELDNK